MATGGATGVALGGMADVVAGAFPARENSAL